MATSKAALDYLRNNLGIAEDPPYSNCNELTRWAGLGCVAWCAITVSRALNEAWGNPDVWQVPGVKADYRWGTAFVPNLRRYFQQAGRYHNTPEPGDVVIYVWGPGEPIGDHTGLVESVLPDGSFIAIEGNTDEGVLARKRRTLDVVDGFGRPPYDAEKKEEPPSTNKELPMEFTYIANVTGNPEDFVYLGIEGFHGRLPFGDTLDTLKKSKQLADLGQQSPQFHEGVKALADTLGFIGDA